MFEDQDVNLQCPIIGACGSGVTGCMLAFSLDQLGIKASVYDVSQGGEGYRRDSRVATKEFRIPYLPIATSGKNGFACFATVLVRNSELLWLLLYRMDHAFFPSFFSFYLFLSL